MSHHKTLYIEINGTSVEIGYVRITNDDVVLSIWIDQQKTLFIPEGDVA